MSQLSDVLVEALKDTFGFIARTINFFIGLLSAVLVAALSVIGEPLDELTTYKFDMFPWEHVLKVMIPPMAIAAVAYIKHREMMAQAINAPVVPEVKATITQQKGN